MPQPINTNLASLNAQRSANRTHGELATSLARLSSGLRINGARDDAAGLAISERFTAQVRGIGQAARNANDGISLAQTADGALGTLGENLQRLRELAVQSANGTNSASDRAALQIEVSQLVGEVDRVARQTEFNGIKLLDGSFAGQAFQVGAFAAQTIASGSLKSMRASQLGVYQGFAVNSPSVGPGTNTTFNYGLQIGSGPVIQLGAVPIEASAMAAAINNARVPGMSAATGPTVAPGAASTASASAAGTAAITLNAVDIALPGMTGTAALAGNRAAAVTAINAHSAATGVVAVDTGSAVSMTAADGRNITFSYYPVGFTGSTAGDFGLSTATYITTGPLSITYEQPPGVTGDAVFLYNGAPTTTYVVGTTGTAVAAMDISTVAGANAAIAALDRSLATVNSSRASLGALQNRFASALGNLQSSGENVTAARSRIQDADFAQETANLSRAQVLQSAGTAMIAQANQTPQQVLALLR